MPSGAKCGSSALKGKPYCYFHTRLHLFKAKPRPGPMDNVKLPFAEDSSAILVGISQILDGLCSCALDAKRAGTALYGLQIASQHVLSKQSVLPSTTVKSVAETETGDEMGPEERNCFLSECSTCDERHTCEDYDPDEDEDKEENTEELEEEDEENE